MLQKPGSTTPRTSRHSRQQPPPDESPDVMIKKLARNPGNRTCCDCHEKLPNSVNVTIGIFLCTTCAGIHRELPSTLSRIKGIGHTIFTKEEIEYIQQHGGNDRINAIYLANYHPSQERNRQPINNSDIRLLRNWIVRKYKDKTWYSNPDDVTSNNSRSSNITTTNTNTSGTSRNNNHNSNSNGSRFRNDVTSSSSSNNNTNTRGVAGMMRQPTVVANIPPKQKVSSNTNQMVDLFDTPTTTTTATNTNTVDNHPGDDEWDAFSNSRSIQHQPGAANNDHFVANFDTATTVVPSAAAAAASFANFDTTGTIHSNTTATSMMTMAQPQEFGNFDSFQSSNNNSMMQQQQHQPMATNNNYSNNNNNSFGSFPSPNMSTTIVGTTATTNMNTSAISTNNGFANFDANNQSVIASNNNTMAQLQPPAPPAATFDKFDAFNSILTSPPSIPTTTTNDISSLTTSTSNMDGKMLVASTGTTPAVVAPTTTKVTKFQSGQKVYYKSSSYHGVAEIVKVHFDDALEPFYTIAMNDIADDTGTRREKQTDDAHLSEYNTNIQSSNDATINSNNLDRTTLQQDILGFVSKLSVVQLQQVKLYMEQILASKESSTTSIASNNTTNGSFISSSMPSNVQQQPTLSVAETLVTAQQHQLGMSTNLAHQQRPSQSISPHTSQIPDFSNFSIQSQQMPLQPPPVQQYVPEQQVDSNMQAQFQATASMPQQYPNQGNQQQPQLSTSQATPSVIPHNQPSFSGDEGGMMSISGSSMMNGPTVVTGGDAFGGIPSPDVGGDSKPLVSQMSSLPPPPLVQDTKGSDTMLQPQQMQQHNLLSMMNPTVPQQPHNIQHHQVPQSTSMIMMNQMPQQQGFNIQAQGSNMQAQLSGQPMMTNYQTQTPSGQLQNAMLQQMHMVPQQQQQQQHQMNQQQVPQPGSNDQAPLSPLSPKGNPFDIY